MTNPIISEKWLPVVGYEGLYSVSDHGRVQSHDRMIGHRCGGLRQWRGMIMKPRLANNGYPTVMLYQNGACRRCLIHRLVLGAFVGICPEGREACHYDGSRDNNYLSNLRWGTRKQNKADELRHGRRNRGERCGSSKLTETYVRAIRDYLDLGLRQIEVAAIFSISKGSISDINRGATWAWLPIEKGEHDAIF